MGDVVDAQRPCPADPCHPDLHRRPSAPAPPREPATGGAGTLLSRAGSAVSDRRIIRALSVSAVLTGLAAGLVVAASPGHADDRILGVAAVAPVRGDSTTPITLTTAGRCPKGTNILTKIFGTGFPVDGENVVGNRETTEFGSPPNDWLVVPLTITLQEAVRRQATPFRLAGDYRIVITCRDPLPSTGIYEYGDYVARLRFGSGGRYQALTTAADLPRPVRKALSQGAASANGEPDPTGPPSAATTEPPATPSAASHGASRSATVTAGALVGGAVVLGAAYLLASRRRDEAARNARSKRPPSTASKARNKTRSKRPAQNLSKSAKPKDQSNRSGSTAKRQQGTTSKR